jgi:pSer/pThr/pTyr-binding forkhead associated (FHA) protein
MATKLVPLGGGTPIPVQRQTVVLGRRSDCDIPLDDGHVSGRHCRLAFENNHWVVTDLGSKNGTHVNGKPAAPRAIIMPNATLAVGRVLKFRVEYSPVAVARQFEKGHDPDMESVLELYEGDGSDNGPETMIHPATQEENDIWIQDRR